MRPSRTPWPDWPCYGYRRSYADAVLSSITRRWRAPWAGSADAACQVESHPDPAALRDRFAARREQAKASLLAEGSDEQTRVATWALGAMKEWLDRLAGPGANGASDGRFINMSSKGGR